MDTLNAWLDDATCDQPIGVDAPRRRIASNKNIFWILDSRKNGRFFVDNLLNLLVPRDGRSESKRIKVLTSSGTTQTS